MLHQNCPTGYIDVAGAPGSKRTGQKSTSGSWWATGIARSLLAGGTPGPCAKREGARLEMEEVGIPVPFRVPEVPLCGCGLAWGFSRLGGCAHSGVVVEVWSKSPGQQDALVP